MTSVKRPALIISMSLGVAVAVTVVLHFRSPHRIPSAGPDLTYRVVEDERFANVVISINDRIPRQEWCAVLSKAATELDNPGRDYMWSDSIFVEARLESDSGVSGTPIATFRRYIPIKNPSWLRVFEFPKDDKCTIVDEHRSSNLLINRHYAHNPLLLAPTWLWFVGDPVIGSVCCV